MWQCDRGRWTRPTVIGIGGMDKILDFGSCSMRDVTFINIFMCICMLNHFVVVCP